MKKNEIAYIKHILDAISRIKEYTNDMEYADFIKNNLVQDGVIRQIEIIGEATKRLSDEIRMKHPEIPWKEMAGMRDKLIHDYLGVDIDAVWETINKDIPVLMVKLNDLIDKEEMS